MAVWFDIDPKSGVPLFKQIVEQVRRAIATGMVQPDERLPTVRELAEEHLLNPNTIAKAYQNLELLGLVYTRPGVRGGTFIAADVQEGAREIELLRFDDDITRLVREGHALGLPADDILVRFAQALRNWYGAYPLPAGIAVPSQMSGNVMPAPLTRKE